MKKTLERDLSEKFANQAAQVKTMRESYSKGKMEKDTTIRDQAEKLQDLRKTNNLVSFNFIPIKFHLVVVRPRGAIEIFRGQQLEGGGGCFTCRDIQVRPSPFST